MRFLAWVAGVGLGCFHSGHRSTHWLAFRDDGLSLDMQNLWSLCVLLVRLSCKRLEKWV